MLQPPQLHHRIHQSHLAGRQLQDNRFQVAASRTTKSKLNCMVARVLLSDGGGSLGGSLSEWLTLGRSDSLVDGSGGSLVDGSFESLVDASRESLVDGEESLSDPLVDPLPDRFANDLQNHC